MKLMAGGVIGPNREAIAIVLLNECDVSVKLSSKYLFIAVSLG